MNILFHCVNGLGLGHLSRMLAIAETLRKQPSNPVLAFMTSAEEHLWLKNAAIPYYYVPSEARFRYTWAVNEDEIEEEARRVSAPEGINDAIFKVLVDHYMPSAVVFDTYFSEDKIVECANCGAIPIAFFDCCECLDVHKPSIDAIRSHGGHVLFGINQCEPWPFRGIDRMHRVGRIVRKPELEPRGEKECSFGKRIPKIICVQGGGGFTKNNSTFYKYNPSFIELIIDALNGIWTSGVEFKALIVLGPYGQWPDHIPQPKWSDIRTFEPQLLSLISRADIMVSTGGYNAVSDSMAACCPAIFLPIKGPTENQEAHVRWLVEKGSAISLPHRRKDLEKELRGILVNPQRLSQMKTKLWECARMSDGMQRAAEIIEDVALNLSLRDIGYE